MVADVKRAEEDNGYVPKPWHIGSEKFTKFKVEDATNFGRMSLFKKMSYMLCNLNTLKYWSVLALCAAVAYHFGSFLVFFAMTTLVFGFIEYLFYFCETNFFDADVLIQYHYAVTTFLHHRGIDAGIDYGFLMYNGDYKKKPCQAQMEKFDYTWDKLGLEEGMTVVDCGCGQGDWLAYLKRRGVKGYGINMSMSQVDECRFRGLDVECVNIKHVKGNKRLEEKFYGIADAVTFWDTIEHYVDASVSHNLEKCDEIYGGVFELAVNMLNKKSKCQTVWNSCMHLKNSHEMGNHRRSLWDSFLNGYVKGWNWKMFVYLVTSRIHGGSYPSAERDTLNTNAKRYGLDLTFRKEMTYDYMITSYLDPDHFGEHRIKWSWDTTMIAFTMVLALPNWWLFWVYYQFGIWSYQFDDDIDVDDNKSCSTFFTHYWQMWTLNGDKKTCTSKYANCKDSVPETKRQLKAGKK